MPYRPPSISDEGLRNHMQKLGLSYAEFDKRMRLAEPYTIIANALGTSRHSIKKYAVQWRIERTDKTE